MASEHDSSLLTQAMVVLAAGVVAVPLFRRAKLGSILGYLAAGVAIGPSGLRVFDDPASIMHFAELGVVLFLFVIGLEIKLSHLWSMRRDIFGLGGLQVVLTGPLVMLYPLLVARWAWQSSLVAGLGLALSSTAMVMQLLAERGHVQAPHGKKAFAILLFQDLAVVPLLALVAFLSPVAAEHPVPVWLSALKMAGALAVVILVGRYLLNPFFRLLASTGAREIMTAAALLVVLAAAGLMTAVGLSSALGAFLAGIMLAESSYRHELEADIEPFRGLLLGLFFVSVGMSVDLRLIPQYWALLLGGLVALTVIKIAVVYGLVRATKGTHETAVMSAALLSQGGEFAFVLFATAVAARVMPQEQSTLLVTLVTMSMALTPLLVALAPRLVPKTQRTRDEDFEGAGGSVLLIGFGRFGQIVSQMLLAEGVDITAIDNDIEMIEAAERFGFKVYFGDGQRLDVLRAAGAERATLICVCVDKPEAATKTVEIAREAFPLARLYVRAFDRGHVLELVPKGIDYHMRETYESAIAFARAALESLERTPDRIAELEAEFRQRDEDRLALQQQGGIDAGKERLHTRPAPKPEPLVQPRRKSVALHEAPAEEASEEQR
ncbi:MAG: monovalent cation:proton antiporter-2 (CPA2) family protein [Labilithrix sp.]|nr:monovalent cation:proton antiporter-2 (CPA2) family protein [Labilithrix sp.]MCW5816819.1 monovalent cation:proton antiporter-2 (CPA2) family protein [Labilithrix sp.]